MNRDYGYKWRIVLNKYCSSSEAFRYVILSTAGVFVAATICFYFRDKYTECSRKRFGCTVVAFTQSLRQQTVSFLQWMRLSKVRGSSAAEIDENSRYNTVTDSVVSSFEDACNRVGKHMRNLPVDLQLKLYGLYKQATCGDNHLPEPPTHDMMAFKKWSSWKELTELPITETRKKYVEICNKFVVPGNSYVDEKDEDIETDFAEFMSGQAHSSLGRIESDSDDDSPVSEICRLVAKGDCATIKKVINASNASSKDSKGTTPLHIAADRGFLDICKHLLDHAADANEQDEYGETPLHIAVWAERADVIELLLKSGADPQLKNNDGESAMELARKSDNFKISKFFSF